MATYTANTIIIKATPHITANTVQLWTVHYKLTHIAANGYSWSWEPSAIHENVSANNKTIAQFTKTDLMGYIDSHKPDRQTEFDRYYTNAHTVVTSPVANTTFDFSTMDD